MQEVAVSLGLLTAADTQAQGRDTRDMEMLWGLDQTRWTAHDTGPEGWPRRAAAAAPVVAGEWPGDESRGRGGFKLAVVFHCRQQPGKAFPDSYLRVLWLHDYRDRMKGVGELQAYRPVLAEGQITASGWDVRAEWETAIGSEGSWRTSYWTTPDRYAVNGSQENGWIRSTVKDALALELEGSDEPGAMGSKETYGLSEAEVRALQSEDVLKLRLPYDYYRKQDTWEAAPGIPAPRRGAKRTRGVNEWRVPLTGSRDAIEAALHTCRGGGG